jgi:hypothetical protein
MRSSKTIALSFAAVIGLGLCLAYFFVASFIFWALAAFTILDVAIWIGIAVAQLGNGARYGGPKTLEEILAEKDRIRMVRLFRYQLGWSPEKIVAEINRRQVFNLGLPWHEDDVRRITRR